MICGNGIVRCAMAQLTVKLSSRPEAPDQRRERRMAKEMIIAPTMIVAPPEARAAFSPSEGCLTSRSSTTP
jgi:hypothetical protein